MPRRRGLRQAPVDSSHGFSCRRFRSSTFKTQRFRGSMIHVHPAHHAASTWRDFFIHIATIVLGLLIAIGLEQTVERIHRHYELRETREALEQERKANEKAWAEDEHDWRRTFVELKNNLTVLEYIRRHPKA